MAVGSDNVFPKLILSEGAAPATPAAGQTKLYAKADGLLYWKDDAGTEYPVGGGGIADQGTFTYLDATEAAAPGTPAAGKSRIYVKADGHFYQKDDAGVETDLTAAGAGSAWTLTVDQSGASFAGWTGLSGTWASTGTIIQQTAGGASVRRAKYNTRIKTADMVMEAEVRFPTGGATLRTGAMFIGWQGTDADGQMILTLYKDTGTTANISLQLPSVASAVEITQTINLDTWYRITARVVGQAADVYLDGVFIGSGRVNNGTADTSFVGLRTYDGTMDFRNIKVWTREDLP